MDFNPLMLIPLLMKNKGDGTQDMTKMLEMMNTLQSSNKNDTIMNMLGVDENTKTILNMMNGQKSEVENNPKEKNECARPQFINTNINEALDKLMNNKNP